MGSGAGTFLKVIFKNFDVLAGPVVSLAYPLYASIRAIETKSPVDDQQWLTYWILYSMITLFELTFAKLIEWIPIWSYAKLIVTCWLVIPYFSGAAYVYEQYVRPFYQNRQSVNIWYVPSKKDVFSKPEDILMAAEKYIKENGPEAFENIIHRVMPKLLSSCNFADKCFLFIIFLHMAICLSGRWMKFLRIVVLRRICQRRLELDYRQNEAPFLISYQKLYGRVLVVGHRVP